MTIFYVYEHWRSDKDACFWVGKGKGRRAYKFKRNKHYNRVVAKLEAMGLCVEVRLVKGELEEREAFLLERERIAFWRAAGVQLTNYTDGGDGTAGLKWSEESRQRARIKQKKVMSSKAMRLRIKKKLKGHQLSGKALENYLVAMAKRQGIKTGPMSEKTKAKIAKKARGRKSSDATRAKMSAIRKQWRWSDEVKAKMSASAKIAQKKRFEKELSTKAGRKRISLRMKKVSAAGCKPGMKSAAAYLAWQRRRAKQAELT